MNIENYEEVWQSFVVGDHISQGATWGVGAGGTGEGLVLIIPIDVPEVVERIEQIQIRLAEQLLSIQGCLLCQTRLSLSL